MSDLTNAFKRLKAAEAEEIKRYFDPGKAAGDKWAKEKAYPSQLKRLARHIEQSGTGDEPGTVEDWIARTDQYGSVADCLCWDLRDPTEEDGDSLEFWEAEIGKSDAKAIQHEGFAAGFIVGALWVWEEYKASHEEDEE